MVIALSLQSKIQILNGARMIADAFFDYPLFIHSIPDHTKRKRQLHVLFETVLTYALKYGFAYATSNQLEGILYGLPYSKVHISNWKIFLCGAWKIPFKLGFSFVSRQKPIEEVQLRLREKYMKSDSVYLWSIAVDPQYQGRGFGKVLLDSLLEKLKDAHQTCYLETVKRKNADIYTHLGFELMEARSVPLTSLTVYSMIKRPL